MLLTFIRFALSPTCSLKRVADKLPFTYTGADLYALGSDAMLKAITRQCRQVDEKVAEHNAALKSGQNPLTIAQYFDHYATDSDTRVTVMEDDFHAAHKELVPSVSAEEFRHYERVRKTFEGNGDESNATSNGSQSGPPKKPLPIPPQATQNQNKLSLPTGHRTSSSQSSSTLRSPMTPLSPTGQKPLGSKHNSQKSISQKSDRSTFFFDQNTNDDDDDEYVIRTDHLHSNGHGNRATKSHRNDQNGGKGKGKPSTFGSATNGDDDMYS
jgi:peroxin-6